MEVFRDPSKRATLICDSSFSELSQYKFLEIQSKAKPRQFTMSVGTEHNGWVRQKEKEKKKKKEPRCQGQVTMFKPTCGDDGLQLSAVDESPFNGLRFDVGPVNPLLQGIVVHHADVVDVWNGQRRHDVHVRVVDVHAADFRPTHVQEESLQCWREDWEMNN